MTDQPYTDTDLVTEAIEQHRALTQDPDYWGVGERMEGHEVGATGQHWGEVLTLDEFATARNRVHGLVTNAADTSAWAVEMGADGLTPEFVTVDDDEDAPNVRVHVAWGSATDTAARHRFMAQLREFMTGPSRAEAELDAVYHERAHLVAHLAAMYPSVLVASAPDAPEWAIVYVDLPTGQASWHIAVRDLPLFADVPTVAAGEPGAVWDGHSTDEKYRRLDEATYRIREGREALAEIEAEAARVNEPTDLA